MKQLTPASPHVIIMVGIPGAGKSAFAEHFAETFKTPYINQSTIARDNALDSDQSARIAQTFLKELFKTHRTLLYEGDTSTKASREVLLEQVIAAGYKPLIVWVQTESLEAKRRALKPHPKGSGYNEHDFNAAIAAFQAPAAHEAAVVISGKHTYASQLKIVLKQLAAERPELKLPSRRPSPVTKRTIVQ